ncbi:MAG TPA: hypothetical protein EYH44_02090 [Thermoprotei archaeon]|nr:hypothetical protein [Thermoprotei archaeon]
MTHNTGEILVIEDISNILSDFYRSILNILPSVFEALTILIIGYIVGRLIGETVRIFLQKFLGLDKWLAMRGLEDAAFGIRISHLSAGLIKWYVYFIFIAESLSRLNIEALTFYLNIFILYYPRIIASATIFIIGLILSEWLKEKVVETMLLFKEFFGSIVKFITATIFFLVALDILTVNVEPIYQLIYFTLGGFVISFSLALGIALGLILKDELRPYVKKILHEVSKQDVDRGDET